MNGAEPVKHLLHDEKRLRLRDKSIPGLQVLGQRPALVEVHHKVGGAVLLEERPNPNDIRMPLELRKGAGFLEEALEPVLEPPFLVLRGCQGLNGVSVTFPNSNVVGQIFLDRHHHLQHLVEGEVGDAKAPHAEHPTDPKLIVEKCLLVERERTAIGRIVLEDVVALHAFGSIQAKEKKRGYT